jgi:hypothetical protein
MNPFLLGTFFTITYIMIAAMATSVAFAVPPEFKPVGGVFGYKITGTSKTSTLQEQKAGGEVYTCLADKVSMGSVANAKEVEKVVFIFTSCENGLKEKCQSGATAGEIVTEALKGRLLYRAKTKEPVLKFKSENPPDFALFKCGAKIHKVLEEVIGAVTPVDKPAKNFTFTFKQTKGVEEILEAEEEGSHALEMDEEVKCPSMSEAGLESTDELEFETETEILA